MQLGEVAHHVVSRDVRRKGFVLRGVAEAGPDRRPGVPGISPEDRDRPGVRLVQTEQEADQGGLPRAVGPEEPGDPATDGEGRSGQGLGARPSLVTSTADTTGATSQTLSVKSARIVLGANEGSG